MGGMTVESAGSISVATGVVACLRKLLERALGGVASLARQLLLTSCQAISSVVAEYVRYLGAQRFVRLDCRLLAGCAGAGTWEFRSKYSAVVLPLTRWMCWCRHLGVQ